MLMHQQIHFHRHVAHHVGENYEEPLGDESRPWLTECKRVRPPSYNCKEGKDTANNQRNLKEDLQFPKGMLPAWYFDHNLGKPCTEDSSGSYPEEQNEKKKIVK